MENNRVPAPLPFLRAFLRIFFNLLYHSFAWGYDLVAAVVSLGNWNDWCKSVINLIQGNKILELGFGTGHLQNALLTQNYQVFGLDESPQMSRITYRRLLKNPSDSVQENIRLTQGDGRHLPFMPNSFDTILATFPTDYIFQPATIIEIHRVLKPQGLLIILASAWITGKSPIHRVLALLFHISGQSPPIDSGFTPFLERLREYNMDGECLWLEEHQSRLLIFRARKR